MEAENRKETLHHSGLNHGLWSQMGLGPNPGPVLRHHWINLSCFLLPRITTLHN